MSIWWARREQLDETQVELIERLPLQENSLVLGPPGSGKTNVLLRRAQFVRGQDMPNVLVLTFTRPLTEFVKTGCYNAQGQEIFPVSLISTLEGWIRRLYRTHRVDIPPQTNGSLGEWKRAIAAGTSAFLSNLRIPKYDAIFVDEAQDLFAEEVTLLRTCSDVLFFVGDDRQQIYEGANGLNTIRGLVPPLTEHTLPFHYRLAPELCVMADRIMVPEGRNSLDSRCHYNGPSPAHIDVSGPLDRNTQVALAITRLKAQLRVYGDMIQQGDRLGVIVFRKLDRDFIFNALENDSELAGMSKIVKSKADDDDRDYDPSIDGTTPVLILTEKGCKGLEFRAVHWLFCNEYTHHRKDEDYYTTVTRAKTSLDIYFNDVLPTQIARSYSRPTTDIWN